MEISNKSAYFHFSIEQKFVAGIMLEGVEVKSIRKGKVSFVDSYCTFVNGELFIHHLHIATFEHKDGFSMLDEKRNRKLLLQKTELKKLQAKVKEKGYSIVPLKIFENEKRFFKLEIGLAKGKKNLDKRQSLKEKELKREVDQFKKSKIQGR